MKKPDPFHLWNDGKGDRLEMAFAYERMGSNACTLQRALKERIPTKNSQILPRHNRTVTEGENIPFNIFPSCKQLS